MVKEKIENAVRIELHTKRREVDKFSIKQQKKACLIVLYV